MRRPRSIRDIAATTSLAITTSALAQAPPLPFFDRAPQRGVIYVVSQGAFVSGSFGCGVAMVDLDGDGDPEIVAIGADDGACALFENTGGGHFVDRSSTANLPNLPDASGVTAADWDGDGDVDLHFTCWLAGDRLLRNNGDLRFVDVTALVGMSESDGAGTGAAWADYDGDGDLDLYVPNRTGTAGDQTRNQLWRNDGNDSFVDVAAELGVDDSGATMQAAWLDFDDDGDPDLYLSTDKGLETQPNRLYRNDGGAFVDVTQESGSGVSIDSMGVGIGDLEGDGDLDIYCTNIPFGNPLLRNEGDGTFVDVAAPWGAQSFATGWAAAFLDFDNDGDLDLKVCNMEDGLNRLYRNDGGPPFIDVAGPANVTAFGDSYAMAIADIDDDGDLDILVQNHEQLLKLFINFEGERREWIRVDVEGVGANRHAIGARLTARVGETVMIREIAAGANYKSANEFTQHFGLDAATQLDSLVVRWRDGAERTLTDVPGHERWRVPHPELLGDAGGDGEFDTDDLPAVQARWNTRVDPGDERFDFNGDFSIDANDGEALLAAWDGPLEDCDGDGTTDVLQIVADASLDVDGDGRLDGCAETTCDLDGDGEVSGSDLLLMLTSWGPCPESCIADLDGDGHVSGADLAALLSSWGPCR